MLETMSLKIKNSPFRNVYWFARYLMNTDQYGAIGKTKESKLLNIVSILENIVTQNTILDTDKLLVCKDVLFREIKLTVKSGTKQAALIDNLIDTLNVEINTLDDILIFCITMKYIVAPINKAIDIVPSNDSEFCEKTATGILSVLGEDKIGLVISTWDTLGVKGCLDIERTVVVDAFCKLLSDLSSLNLMEHSQLDDNLLLTAFMQEFERRLAQKRKMRGGISLESAVNFLFKYYDFPSASSPDHFDQDLEVDKWFKCKDGWLIGISCKRTLRERWKQVSQADRGTLSHFKIKELWHIISYDKDLSDDKIVRLGEQGQIFYLTDESDTYKKCSSHIGMKDYVRPLSMIISDIRTNLNG